MRPKKRVLIYGATENAASILRLVLESRGYAVEAVFAERLLKRRAVPDALLLVGSDAVSLPWATGIVMVRARGIEPEGVWIANILAGLKKVSRKKFWCKSTALKEAA